MTTPTEALHRQIMNLLDKVDDSGVYDPFCRGYTMGHRDACHAAAELVSAAIAQPQPSAPSAPSVEPAFDILAHLKRQAEFSAKTFGPGARVEGVTDHIAKELAEVRESGGDLAEWVDVIILAFDGAWRSGASPAQIIDAMVAKQTKNEGRKWPDWRTAPAEKAIEHDRSGEVGAAPLMANGLTEAETADERYCLFCDKAGHQTHECHSTHGLNTPADRELYRLACAAAPQAATASVVGLAEWRDEAASLMMFAQTAMHASAKDQRNALEDIADRLAAVLKRFDGGAAPQAAPVSAPAWPTAQHGAVFPGLLETWAAWKAQRASAPAVAAPEPTSAAPLPAREQMSDDDILKCVRSIGLPSPMGLTRDRGPYEVTEPTYYLQRLVRAVEAAHGITAAPTAKGDGNV